VQLKASDFSVVVFLHQVCDLYLRQMQAQLKKLLSLDNQPQLGTLCPLRAVGCKTGPKSVW
jgi:hypothetical protein